MWCVQESAEWGTQQMKAWREKMQRFDIPDLSFLATDVNED